ncbi:MAG: hypothetical protein WCP95_12525 [Actinomycetes bacterium]
MRARIALCLVAAGMSFAVSPSVAQAAGDPVVIVGSAVPAKASTISVGGRELMLGYSTRADVRRAEGRAANGAYSLPGRNGGGVVVVYKSTAGRCERQYTFPRGSTRVSDFETTCAAARTYNGVRPGMTAARAAALSGSTWTDAKFGDRVCPVVNRVMQMTTHPPYLVAWSDGGGALGVEKVDSIGVFSENALLFQTARCGSSTI